MYQTFLKPLYLDVKTFVLDTLFPISCLACGEEGLWICADCKSTIGKLEHQRCIVCQKNTPFGLTHPHCQTPHGADGLISFLNYHDKKVADILIKGKYNFLPGVYQELGKIIAEKIQKDFPNLTPPPPSFSDFAKASSDLREKEGATAPTLRSEPRLTNVGAVAPPLFKRGGWEGFVLVPIPLHSTRKRWRGFNQAEVLCQSISEQLNLPVADVLRRNKITKTQKDLKKDARLKNVDNAFSLSPSPLARGDVPSASEGQRGRTFEKQNYFDIHDKNIILVDDVTTTGATLQEAAKVLKRNGASKVICLTIARD